MILLGIIIDAERGDWGISRWEKGTEPRNLPLLVKVKEIEENLRFPYVASSNRITRFAQHLRDLVSRHSGQGALVIRTTATGEVHHVMIVVPYIFIFT